MQTKTSEPTHASPEPLRVLVVGQTPPPLHGQAVMISALLAGEYPGLELVHVPMGFSREIEEVGRPTLRKVAHLAKLITNIIVTRFATGADVLYYPPAGPRPVPIVRDVAVLFATRWMFRRTVFHFHASGLANYLDSLAWPWRLIAKRAFRRPDVAITLSPSVAEDARDLAARNHVTVPNGAADAVGATLVHSRASDEPLRILYVGALSSSKGLLDLVQIVAALRSRGCAVEATCVGRWASEEFRQDVERRIAEQGAQRSFRFPGVLSGAHKWQEFRSAHVFVFPTYYESEALPVAVIEAMMSSLPVIASNWRGIPDMVRDGWNALLLPPRDVPAFAAAIQRLAADEQLRRDMGARSREWYVEHFTLDAHRDGMRRALLLAS